MESFVTEKINTKYQILCFWDKFAKQVYIEETKQNFNFEMI